MRLGEGSAGRAPTLDRIQWHLLYNGEKITEQTQSGYPKGAQLTSDEHDSFIRLGHRWR